MDFDQFLREACPPLGLNWRKYRRRMARHRVKARMHELGLPGYEALLERLRDDPSESAQLADRMRITVTRFFREGDRWDGLAASVLPHLLEAGEVEEPTRMWCIGSCGGEEPYTLALLWLDRLQPRFSSRRVDILATDIDAPSLERARVGIYGAGSLREVPPDLRRRYFRPAEGGERLVDEVRRVVSFVRHNFMEDPLPGKFDLLCCRYLAFTYYRGERLLRAARRLHESLRPGGALMIGRKEDLDGARDLFENWPGVPGVFLRT